MLMPSARTIATSARLPGVRLPISPSRPSARAPLIVPHSSASRADTVSDDGLRPCASTLSASAMQSHCRASRIWPNMSPALWPDGVDPERRRDAVAPQGHEHRGPERHPHLDLRLDRHPRARARDLLPLGRRGHLAVHEDEVVAEEALLGQHLDVAGHVAHLHRVGVIGDRGAELARRAELVDHLGRGRRRRPRPARRRAGRARPGCRSTRPRAGGRAASSPPRP